MRSGLTCLRPSRMTAATWAGVSTVSLATSTAPRRMSLSPSRAMREMGNRAAARLLPVVVGLDAVAVADVDGGAAAETFHRRVQRGQPPVAHLVHVDVEGGLVELDHVHAQRLQLPRL